MNRHSARKNYSDKQGLARWQMALLAGLAAAVVGGAVIYFCLHKSGVQTGTLVSSYVSRFRGWVGERKTHLNHGLDKVKKLAANKTEAEPQIHFEFYTALPKMQVKVADLTAKTGVSAAPVRPAGTDKIAADVRKDKKAAAGGAAIASASELEQELSAQLTNSEISGSPTAKRKG